MNIFLAPVPRRLSASTKQGVPQVKAAYFAALRACAKGADWERAIQLLDNYLKVRLKEMTTGPFSKVPFHSHNIRCTLLIILTRMIHRTYPRTYNSPSRLLTAIITCWGLTFFLFFWYPCIRALHSRCIRAAVSSALGRIHAG